MKYENKGVENEIWEIKVTYEDDGIENQIHVDVMGERKKYEAKLENGKIKSGDNGWEIEYGHILLKGLMESYTCKKYTLWYPCSQFFLPPQIN